MTQSTITGTGAHVVVGLLVAIPLFLLTGSFAFASLPILFFWLLGLISTALLGPYEGGPLRLLLGMLGLGILFSLFSGGDDCDMGE